jgi:hypothetical protein
VYLPGQSTVSTLVPPLDYKAALDILNAMMNELEADLPELRYYSLKDSQLSGKAIKLTLAGAIDRAEEARKNFIQGLMRVNKIALTLGKFWGLFQVGNYENGDLDHNIISAEFFPQDDTDKATLMKELVAAGLALATALRVAGYDEDFIQQALADKQAEATASQNALADTLTNFNQA